VPAGKKKEEDFSGKRASKQASTASGDMAKALEKAFEPIWNWASRRYQAAVAKELKKYGLRYDDLLDDMYDLDIKEALSRLPQQEVDLRNQRLKRAMDYSGKHTYMPKALQAKQTPYLSYLQDTLQLVKEERKEHAELGSDMPYNRPIP
jgi:ubiquinol-cytochrome c reductase subunit 7